jgi:hypothetical protein
MTDPLLLVVGCTRVDSLGGRAAAAAAAAPNGLGLGARARAGDSKPAPGWPAQPQRAPDPQQQQPTSATTALDRPTDRQPPSTHNTHAPLLLPIPSRTNLEKPSTQPWPPVSSLRTRPTSASVPPFLSPAGTTGLVGPPVDSRADRLRTPASAPCLGLLPPHQLVLPRRRRRLRQLLLGPSRSNLVRATPLTERACLSPSATARSSLLISSLRSSFALPQHFEAELQDVIPIVNTTIGGTRIIGRLAAGASRSALAAQPRLRGATRSSHAHESRRN